MTARSNQMKEYLPGIERLILSCRRASFSILLSTSRLKITFFVSTNDIKKMKNAPNANDIIPHVQAYNSAAAALQAFV